MASDLNGRSLGHFRVVEKIGEGGMGVVYVAMDQRLRRTVALKVLRPEIADDQRRRGRFLREARFAASLAHPNVCMVHEVGESDGLVYMAMELLEGSSLRVRLARGRVPPVQVLTIARDVARALARAHEKGIIHRDLKPDNVIVYEPNPGVLAAKVLDFGLAKALDFEAKSPEHENTATFVTAHGVAIGTPGYMAPEQAKGLEVDARADVYSFGVMLYEMLTGRSPYKGRSPEELIAAAGREELRPPSELVRGLPAGVDAFYMRCCDRAINRRFADGGALVAAIQPLLEPSPKVLASGSGAFDEVTAQDALRGSSLEPALPTMSVPPAFATQSLAESIELEEDITGRRGHSAARFDVSADPTEITDLRDHLSLAPLEETHRLSSSPPPPVPLSIPSGALAQRSGVRAVHFLGFVAMGLIAFFVSRMAVLSTSPAAASVAPATPTTPMIDVTTQSPVAAPAAAPPTSIVTTADDEDVVVETVAPAAKPAKTAKPHRGSSRPTPSPAASPLPAAAVPSPAPAPAPAEDCSSPFYVNSEGIRVPKRQCLR